MNINRIVRIFFSPTHTTKKVIDAITNGLGINNHKTINLNRLEKRRNFYYKARPGEALILGIPVYEERIPDLLYPVLAKLNGQGQPMIVVTNYGNICAGIALKQLYKMMKKQGFKIIAAAHFIGEHSFSSEDIKVAAGRPDKEDLSKATLLGQQIKEKMSQFNDSIDLPELSIHGKLLLMGKVLPKHSENIFTYPPKLIISQCHYCLKCLKACPVNAINPENLTTRDRLCIRCFACVKFCPHNARKIMYKKPILVKTVLKNKGQKRQEPEIFI